MQMHFKMQMQNANAESREAAESLLSNNALVRNRVVWPCVAPFTHLLPLIVYTGRPEWHWNLFFFIQAGTKLILKNKNPFQKRGYKKTSEKEAGKDQEKKEEQKKTNREKDKNRKTAQTANLQIIENLIQFLQLELCGISDCENRSTETCRSGNEDYQPL